MYEGVGTKENGKHRRGRRSRIKGVEGRRKDKNNFAPHVSPLMIGHSFEDDIVTVYSEKQVIRGKGKADGSKESRKGTVWNVNKRQG